MVKNIKIFNKIISLVSKSFKLSGINKYSFLLVLLLLLSIVTLKVTTQVFAVDDITPPTAPTSLHISGTTPNSVSLAWNASTDDVGVEGYRVYRNGITAPSTQLLTYTYYNLPAGSHVFFVRAFDLAGNVSSNSNNVFYFSIGTTGPTPTPTVTNTPTPTPTYTPTPTPTITVVSFNAIKDNYVKSGSTNKNEGANTTLIVQSSGKNRSIVDFGTAPMANLQVGPSDVISAVLRVTIDTTSNNWGASGRNINLHSMIQNWAEGNGSDGVRGTGNGATWNCAIDSDISNTSANCSGSADWDMTSTSTIWTSTPSDSETITNGLTGVVDFDVTTDVRTIMQGTTYYGWIIKVADEGQSGKIEFNSRETANPPVLIITHR